jgi:hypothetical protein
VPLFPFVLPLVNGTSTISSGPLDVGASLACGHMAGRVFG